MARITGHNDPYSPVDATDVEHDGRNQSAGKEHGEHQIQHGIGLLMETLTGIERTRTRRHKKGQRKGRK